MSNTSESDLLATCWYFFLLLAINLTVGGWSVNYLLGIFLEKIPFAGAAVIGLFVGEFTIPAAIGVAILRFFGVM